MSFGNFYAIANVIGADSALRFCAFFGAVSPRLLVPRTVDENHLLEKLIGFNSARALCERWGGCHIDIPVLDLAPLQNAGRIVALNQAGMSVPKIARMLSLTPARVSQIQRKFYANDIDLQENIFED